MFKEKRFVVFNEFNSQLWEEQKTVCYLYCSVDQE